MYSKILIAHPVQFCYNQRDQTRRRDRLGGFHTVDYEIGSAQQMTVDGHHFQLLNVQLKCDKVTFAYDVRKVIEFWNPLPLYIGPGKGLYQKNTG